MEFFGKNSLFLKSPAQTDVFRSHRLIPHTADNAVISPRGHTVNQEIAYGKHQIAHQRNKHQKRNIRQAKQHQKLLEHREGEGQMHARENQREEKDGEDLELMLLRISRFVMPTFCMMANRD